MSNEPKPPMAFNKSEGIRAKVEQIDWGSRTVFVTYPNPDGGVRIGDFWDFSVCEILPFVCLDKSEDKVFAGDNIRGWIRRQCRNIEDPDHDDGVMSWDARGLVWRLKTDSFQKSIMHNYDCIELIKEDDK